jgi:hypothetical protein
VEFDPEVFDSFMAEVQAPASPNRSEKATSKHIGVYLKQRNKKWAARLCLKSRKKLDLGEYNTHDDAARAHQVGAFYYNKPLDSTSSQSFVGSLPSVPDNLSDEEKRRWVRERARHYALTVNGESASKSVLLAGSGALEAPHGAQASYNFPTASGSALPDANELLDFDDFVGFEGEEFSAEKRKPEEVTGSNAGAADVQEKNQALPHITNATDSELFALYELRKQGWNYRLKSLSPISVKAGVLFALPQGQQTSPPLLMTDIILRSFQELREQGWEVHLEPSKRDEVNFPLYCSHRF